MMDEEKDRVFEEPYPLDAFDSEAATPRRFCRHCGQQIDLNIGECRACASAQAGSPPPDDLPPARSHLFRSSLGLYFLLLATSLGVLAAGMEELGGDVTVTVLDAVIVLIAALVFRREIARGFLRLGAPRWYLLALGLALLTYALSELSVSFLVRVFKVEEILYTTSYFEAGYGFPWVVLAVCIQPAVVEEIAFRGIILSGMLQVLDRKEALLVSSLLFMTIHLNVLSFPHLFVIGLALGYLRIRTGSLYPGMLLHFTHNLLCVLGEL